MLKASMVSLGLAILLSACANTPSPQERSPSQAAQCGALRTKMLQSPLMDDNNTPTAIADQENVSTQDTYHKQCE